MRVPKHPVHLISRWIQHPKPSFFFFPESNFCNILTFSIWPGWKRWKDLPLKSDHGNNITGKLYITFSLPVVISDAPVHLVIQRIDIFSIQLCVSDTLSLSFFPWFCQGRGDYLKEGTYAAWAGFGQQGLRANNPLLSNELWFFFPFFFFQTKKEYVKPLWTQHWSHITATVGESERKSNNAPTLRKVRTKTKHPPRLHMSTTCEGKTITLQYFGMGFGAVSKVTVPKEL